MRIYLDNCCFNRPFDDQRQPRIRLEAEAKLFLQEGIRSGKLELAWSYILDYENAANPFEERKSAVSLWKVHAVLDVSEQPEVLKISEDLCQQGMKSKDALHVACAIVGQCDCFVTTDEKILRKLRANQEIQVLDPPALIRRIEL
jgi:predicted nucleic acid-binding protein